jgi:hypothetical protein
VRAGIGAVAGTPKLLADRQARPGSLEHGALRGEGAQRLLEVVDAVLARAQAVAARQCRPCPVRRCSLDRGPELLQHAVGVVQPVTAHEGFDQVGSPGDHARVGHPVVLHHVPDVIEVRLRILPPARAQRQQPQGMVRERLDGSQPQPVGHLQGLLRMGPAVGVPAALGIHPRQQRQRMGHLRRVWHVPTELHRLGQRRLGSIQTPHATVVVPEPRQRVRDEPQRAALTGGSGNSRGVGSRPVGLPTHRQPAQQAVGCQQVAVERRGQQLGLGVEPLEPASLPVPQQDAGKAANGRGQGHEGPVFRQVLQGGVRQACRATDVSGHGRHGRGQQPQQRGEVRVGGSLGGLDGTVPGDRGSAHPHLDVAPQQRQFRWVGCGRLRRQERQGVAGATGLVPGSRRSQPIGAGSRSVPGKVHRVFERPGGLRDGATAQCTLPCRGKVCGQLRVVSDMCPGPVPDAPVRVRAGRGQGAVGGASFVAGGSVVDHAGQQGMAEGHGRRADGHQARLLGIGQVVHRSTQRGEGSADDAGVAAGRGRHDQGTLRGRAQVVDLGQVALAQPAMDGHGPGPGTDPVEQDLRE